jgi:hypothetical protein
VWVWFKPASHLEELRLQSRQRFRSKGASQLIRWNAAPRQAGSLPDQRFIKSRDPVGSDFALSGATALPASGKLGAAGAVGPISEISRFTMARVPAGEYIGDYRVILGSVRKCGEMECRHLCLGTKQISSPNLHSRGAQRKGGSDAARVRDSSRGDDRNSHRVCDLREAMHRLFRVKRDLTGNFRSLPGVFPDTMAPVVRTRAGWRARADADALGLSAAAKSRDGSGDERAQSEIAVLARLAQSRIALSCASNLFLRMDRHTPKGNALVRAR